MVIIGSFRIESGVIFPECPHLSHLLVSSNFIKILAIPFLVVPLFLPLPGLELLGEFGQLLIVVPLPFLFVFLPLVLVAMFFHLVLQTLLVGLLHNFCSPEPLALLELGPLALLLERVVDMFVLHVVPLGEGRDIGLEVLLLVGHQHLVVVLVAQVLQLLHLLHVLEPLVVALALLLLLLLLELFLFVSLLHQVVELLLVELFQSPVLVDVSALLNLYLLIRFNN